jgi:hypothetical protein
LRAKGGIPRPEEKHDPAGRHQDNDWPREHLHLPDSDDALTILNTGASGLRRDLYAEGLSRRESTLPFNGAPVVEESAGQAVVQKARQTSMNDTTRNLQTSTLVQIRVGPPTVPRKFADREAAMGPSRAPEHILAIYLVIRANPRHASRAGDAASA